MTLPWKVPRNTVIVEEVIGGWHVLPHGQPMETFDRKDEATARARVLATQHLREWNIVIKPLPGPFGG